MKYFLIAGEASGDLHAAGLMHALKEADAEADFRFYGGDNMAAESDGLLRHYNSLAYMGFIPVLLHLPEILKGMKTCQEQIEAYRPDAVILVDYAGFNLRIARYVKEHHICPVFYYISPKIWAWKEGRIKQIRRYVDHLYAILPFEKAFFEEKHHYPITYVGNPTADEVAHYMAQHGAPSPDGHTVALLPGSRQQELRDNLTRMLRAVKPLQGGPWRFCIAMAPSQPRSRYEAFIAGSGIDPGRIELVEGETYALLSRAEAALVTSGTATLETALFGVPQVVCYYTRLGRLFHLLRRFLLKVSYISLVNLIAGREVVKELVCHFMTPERVREELLRILPGGEGREAVLQGYADVKQRLGATGAPEHAAAEMLRRLRQH